MTQDNPADMLYDALASVTDITEANLLDGSMADVIMRLDATNRLLHRLRSIADALELALIPLLPDDGFHVEHVGTVRRNRRKSTRLRYDGASQQMRLDIARAVANSVAVDVFTGEIDMGKRDVAYSAVTQAWEVVPSFSNMKVAGAKRFGLSLEDYVETSFVDTLVIEQEATA
jgi:hypothetical protein